MSDKEFKQAVRNEFKDCELFTLAKKRSHLVRIIDEIWWDAKTALETEEEAKKLSSHIQGLAKMHELLLDQSNENLDGTHVNIEPIITEIINTIRKSIPQRKLISNLVDVFLPSRMACTISVIVNNTY